MTDASYAFFLGIGNREGVRESSDGGERVGRVGSLVLGTFLVEGGHKVESRSDALACPGLEGAVSESVVLEEVIQRMGTYLCVEGRVGSLEESGSTFVGEGSGQESKVFLPYDASASQGTLVGVESGNVASCD